MNDAARTIQIAIRVLDTVSEHAADVFQPGLVLAINALLRSDDLRDLILIPDVQKDVYDSWVSRFVESPEFREVCKSTGFIETAAARKAESLACAQGRREARDEIRARAKEISGRYSGESPECVAVRNALGLVLL